MKLFSFWGKKTESVLKPSPEERRRNQIRLMNQLIKACNSDKETAIRLIERERTIEPSLKTMEAIDRAMSKLCRDRGAVIRN